MPVIPEKDGDLASRRHLSLAVLFRESPAADSPFQVAIPFEIEEDQPEAATDLAEMVRRLLEILLFDARGGRRTRLRRDALCVRLIALAWLSSPGLFKEKSLRQLARAYKVDPGYLARYCADFTRRFPILKNARSSHGWNRRPAAQPAAMAG